VVALTGVGTVVFGGAERVALCGVNGARSGVAAGALVEFVSLVLEGVGVLALDFREVVALGALVTMALDPAEPICKVKLSRMNGDVPDIRDAPTWLTTDSSPRPDPFVGALSREVGLWCDVVLGSPPLAAPAPAPAPAPGATSTPWGLPGTEGTSGAVNGTDTEVPNGVWPEPTVNPKTTSDNAAATPETAATARSYGRLRSVRVAVVPSTLPKLRASATGWPKSCDVKTSSRVL